MSDPYARLRQLTEDAEASARELRSLAARPEPLTRPAPTNCGSRASSAARCSWRWPPTSVNWPPA